MLNYAILFFILAIVAAVFGFGGLAASFASIAQFMAVLFVVLFVVSLIYHFMTGREGKTPIG